MSMHIIHAAKGRVDAGMITRYINSLPNQPQDMASEWFQRGFCSECLEEAARKPRTPEITMGADYALKAWPGMAPETSGGIRAQLLNTQLRLQDPAVRDLLAGEESTVTPALLDDGFILVGDTPILTHHAAGQACQVALKLSAYRWAMRRQITPESRPVCLWADEAQNHVLPRLDAMTLAVGRSQKFFQVAITQNIPLLTTAGMTKAEAHAYIGNFGTKILFNNTEFESNEYFSKMLGHSKHLFYGGGTNYEPYSPTKDLMGAMKCNANFHQQYFPDVPPEEFQKLRKGGPPNFLVDAIVHHAQAQFSSNGNKNWLKTTFQQMV
jgi:hypothetical protein